MDGADGVYPASEDTYLLMDVLKQDESIITEAMDVCGLYLEVGCGSGEVTESIATLLMNHIGFSTDVNSLATAKTARLLEKKAIRNTELVLCDLFTAFKPGTQFDLIVFNPPYVPTDSDELYRALTTRDISASWAGGADGREVVDKFLDSVHNFLSRRGLLYLVLLEDNYPSDVASKSKQVGLSCTIVLKRSAGIETLYVLRFQKRNNAKVVKPA